jgi:hypothetical protein
VEDDVLVISAGMQKAATGTYFNLTNDLLVAAGHPDVHVIRNRYRMASFTTEVNCNVGPLRAYKMAWLLVPSFAGHTYVVKTHEGPSPSARLLLRMGMARSTYIYRDPRDVSLSLFEHGQRIRTQGIRSSTRFDRLMTIGQAIEFASTLLPTWEAWTTLPGVHVTTYEALIGDITSEARRLAHVLGLSLDDRRIVEIAKPYRRESIQSAGAGIGSHFHKGKSGRWGSQFSPEELALSEQLFGEYLEPMGYHDA